MQNTKETVEQAYSETEAAEHLGITVERLYKLLDRNIFTDGSSRPANLTLPPPNFCCLGSGTGWKEMKK